MNQGVLSKDQLKEQYLATATQYYAAARFAAIEHLLPVPGRLLAYMYVGELMIDAELVRRGYAQAATFPPNANITNCSAAAAPGARGGAGALEGASMTQALFTDPRITRLARIKPVISIPEPGDLFPDRSYHAIRKQKAWGLKRPHRGAPEPKGLSWTEADNAVLRAYAVGNISEAELRAQLPGRTWDAIEHQGRVLGLSLRRTQVFYQIVNDERELDERELIDTKDHSTMGW